jgi:putative nucleotidyltransferase with HDIG domain
MTHPTVTTQPPTLATAQTLLDILTAGADAPLYTADAWAARAEAMLGRARDSFIAAFIDQLAVEWQPAAPPPGLLHALCVDCAAQALNHIATAQNPGWPHLWAHTGRVAGYALACAEQAGVDPGLAYLLGILHDVGKLDERRTGVAHEAAGALFAQRALYERLEPDTVTRLAGVIAKRARPRDPLAQLLHDADKLDKIGATGIARRLSTDFGAAHIRQALDNVQADAEAFPPMHFRAARTLAEAKLAFTRPFVRLVRAATPWL